MSFPDPVPPFMPPPFSVGGDASGFWPQFPMSNEYSDGQFEQPPPFKKPRNSEENQSNSTLYPPMIPRIHPANAPINPKGVNNIFFKTRMCAKFRVGQCRNGENCNFAHGMEDMRQPPPNWQDLVNGPGDDRGSGGNWDDDQRIIHKMKLCKKYYNGEECPYGERCNFLHEDPKKFRDDTGRFRESSAISIGVTGPPPSGLENVPEQPDNKSANNGLDAYRPNMRPVYWKTKLCSRYEATGQCPFAEKCHFAHGQAELQLPGGRSEGEMGITVSIPIKPIISALSNDAPHYYELQLPGGRSEGEMGITVSIPIKPIISALSNDAPSSNMVPGVMFIQEASEKKRLLKWKGPKKINRIYADWIDDLPLVNSLTANMES